MRRRDCEMAHWSLPDWSLELPVGGRHLAETTMAWRIVVPPSAWMAAELVGALVTRNGGAGLPAGVLVSNEGCHVDWLDACASGNRSKQAGLVSAAIDAAGIDKLPSGNGLLWVVACGSYARSGPGLLWEGRLRRLQRSRVAYEEASAMLSTLGGGHFLCRHLPQAEALALAQQRLALSVGDSRQAVRCGVHLCYAAMAAGDPYRAAWRLCGAAVLGMQLSLLGREEASKVCSEATAAVHAAGWLPGGELAAEAVASPAGEVSGGGEVVCAARSGAGEAGGSSTSVAATSRSADPGDGDDDSDDDDEDSEGGHLAGGHAVLSTLHQRWPGDVGGAAGVAAPRTAPPAGELGGMVTSAGAYISTVGTWLAKERRQGRQCRDTAGTTGDDFSRQRPGAKTWQPPVVTVV